MDKVSGYELARSWYFNNPIKQSGKLSESRLFRMLYNAYCKRIGSSQTFDDVVRSSSYRQACTALFSWYTDRYAVGFGMAKGTQGQTRIINCNSTAYTFDALYCDDRQFKAYLDTDTPQSGNQDLLAFVLHTAVAFLVPPGELDVVLQKLGFHPLHVKNVHHLAIYSVLLAAENQPADNTFNPFRAVRDLYFRAQEILGDEAPVRTDGYCFAGLDTKLIRQTLFLNKALLRENFEALVSINKTALNMRHSLILSDLHKFAAVFIHLYDIGKKSDSLDVPETEYSFLNFINRFCMETLSRRHYRANLTSMIDRNQKHPTRSIMILLWMFSYCFAFLPGVYLEKKFFDRIVKQLKKERPDWAAEAEAYYNDPYFDVYGFLSGELYREPREEFRGEDMLVHINAMLQLRYGWGPLNPRLPFDYYICQFADLVIPLEHDCNSSRCNSVLYKGRKISDINANVVNVPCPLAAITQLLMHLNTVIAKEAPFQKDTKLSKRPLKCSLYEQL